MTTSFTLEVVLTDYSSSSSSSDAGDVDVQQRNRLLLNDDTQNVIVANASLLRLSQQFAEINPQRPRFAAVFLPSTLVEAALKELSGGGAEINTTSSSIRPLLSASDQQRKLSKSLLSMTHPFLEQNFFVRAILSVRRNNNSKQQQQQHFYAPADVVLLDLSHAPAAAVADLLEATNSQLVHAAEQAVLSILLVSSVHFSSSSSVLTSSGSGENNNPQSFDIPACPVCLYRIDPIRLGLPKTPIHHQCSKFCPPPNLLFAEDDDENNCPRQRLLRPWPLPSRCRCCQVICNYWKQKTEHDKFGGSSSGGGGEEELSDLFCCRCAMQETLWVCMTCGFVGCGRYSNKHAAEHFQHSGHPYSLELATLRVWEYVTGEFAHRPDLLECPSSPPVWHQWMRRTSSSSSTRTISAATTATLSMTTGDVLSASAATATSTMNGDFHSSAVGGTAAAAAAHRQRHHRQVNNVVSSIDEKSPKKATMIGEEYEALLHSALQDQAQHFEGETSRLLAKLTAEDVDASSMTAAEKEVTQSLQSEIQALRSGIAAVGRELLDAQAQEAGHRATSQRLLRAQQVSQELLNKIREESVREQQQGERQIEELEQQIADLTANQRMRDQFSQDDELRKAQIFGTTSNNSETEGGATKPRKKGGKKSRQGLLRRPAGKR